MIPALFSLTLFLSAALLMAVQPLVGRMLLPALGGSPAVWNTCLVFFQAVLLLGYLYSHVLAGKVTPKLQLGIHMLVLAAAFLTLPIALGGSAPLENDEPIGWLLKTLLFHVGPAFFAVSTTAPLLQRWFSETGLRGSRDPYFLYAASNLGSLALLVCYPLLIEPNYRLAEQAGIWKMFFLSLGCLIFVCGLVPRKLEVSTAAAATEDRPVSPWRWIALAFIPSSLLQSVTTYITTDVASMPLLWMIPLGLYFITFIWAFSVWVPMPLRLVSSLVSIGILTLFLLFLFEATEPLTLILGVHLFVFFFVCVLCHGTLAKERPAPAKLTAFYLWIAVGGVLGSGFNALLAPILFQSFGQVEYPLMLIAACLVRPDAKPVPFGKRDLLAPAILTAVVGFLILIARQPFAVDLLHGVQGKSGLPFASVRGAFLYGVPIIVVFTLVERRFRFVLALLGLYLVSSLDGGATGQTLLRSRNHLGTLKVTRDSEHPFTRLVHGRTVHGQEWLDDAKRREPLTYYHPDGPMGHLMNVWREGRNEPLKEIGAVGLGVGSLLAYAKRGENWTYFELDPDVVRIAKDERFFHFIKDTKAGKLDFRLGDARLRLKEEPDGKFDLLILDAFSSDSIPMHLVTKEAVEMYVRKLKPSGLLVFHLSNRYLDLPPVLGRIAAEHEPPLLAREYNDFKDDPATGKFPCDWLMLARSKEDLGSLRTGSFWVPVIPPQGTPLWTDDFSNVIDILKGPPTKD